jgi:hypothetical protein
LGIERFLVNALAIALQRGNAAILREGVTHLLHPTSRASGTASLLRSSSSGHAAPAFSLRAAYGWAMSRSPSVVDGVVVIVVELVVVVVVVVVV